MAVGAIDVDLSDQEHDGDFINAGFVERVISEPPPGGGRGMNGVFVYGIPIPGGTAGPAEF